MFRIGEFSKIARVSGRLLRYYDEIGLFGPAQINPETGYRYYSAGQLSDLNRILALKDLGLTLDQIARLVQDNPSVEEIRGMLTMKKAEIEQSLGDELRRIRNIESRIEQIERQGAMGGDEVVLKQVPDQRFLSYRGVITGAEEGLSLMGEIVRALPAQVGRNALGNLALVMHGKDFDTVDADIELGYLLAGDYDGTASLSGDRTMTVRDLPGTDTMATLVVVGSFDYAFIAYNTMGQWMETHGYRFAGSVREIMLEISSLKNVAEWVREIQIPVEPVAAGALLAG